MPALQPREVQIGFKKYIAETTDQVGGGNPPVKYKELDRASKGKGSGNCKTFYALQE